MPVISHLPVGGGSSEGTKYIYKDGGLIRVIGEFRTGDTLLLEPREGETILNIGPPADTGLPSTGSAEGFFTALSIINTLETEPEYINIELKALIINIAGAPGSSAAENVFPTTTGGGRAFKYSGPKIKKLKIDGTYNLNSTLRRGESGYLDRGFPEEIHITKQNPLYSLAQPFLKKFTTDFDITYIPANFFAKTSTALGIGEELEIDLSKVNKFEKIFGSTTNENYAFVGFPNETIDLPSITRFDVTATVLDGYGAESDKVKHIKLTGLTSIKGPSNSTSNYLFITGFQKLETLDLTALQSVDSGHSFASLTNNTTTLRAIYVSAENEEFVRNLTRSELEKAVITVI